MDERDTGGSHNSKKTAIRTQTPTRGQPLRGPSVLTGHSSLMLEQPAPKSAMSNQLASHGVDNVVVYTVLTMPT